MRQLIAAAMLVCAVAACTPPAAAPSDTQTTATATVATTSTPAPAAFTLDANALGGQWSFARDCGLFDLVFTKTGVSYYDYSNHENVVSYDGTWTIAPNNSVVLTLHRLDAQGAPTGDALTYNLNVTAPISPDLTGTFGPPGSLRDINAKQCANEDRE